MKKLILFVSLALFASTAFASVHRIVIDNENKSKSSLEYKITFDQIAIENKNKYRVRVSLPKEQQSLSELWKIYLWVSEPSLSIPIEYRLNKFNKNLELIFTADKQIIQQSTLAIRCGEYAPAAEVIYQMNLGSFLEAHNKALNKDATYVAPVN